MQRNCQKLLMEQQVKKFIELMYSVQRLYKPIHVEQGNFELFLVQYI